jgi:hypothetical protein
MTQEYNKKEQIWTALFVVTPTVIFSNFVNKPKIDTP